MIIFYDTRNGRIFSTIDGRVHDEKTINSEVFDDTVPKEFVGKKVIGWEETQEIESYKEIQNLETATPEEFATLPLTEKKKIISESFDGKNNIQEIGFYKIKKIKMPVHKRIEHNLKDMELLQRFEDNTEFSPCTHVKIDLETQEFIEVEPPVRIHDPAKNLERIGQLKKRREELLKNKEVSLGSDFKK